MVDIIEFPANLRISDRSDPQLMFNTRSGGIALDGGEQILSPLSERWEWRAVVPVVKGHEARTIRIIKARMKGRFNYLRMRVCDQYRITRRDIGAAYSADSVPHSDGAYFSDASGYELAQPRAAITAAGAQGAESISVQASAFGGAITAGVFFSINDWLYQVNDWQEDGDNYTLDISPPLREAVTTADEADFDATCLWAFAADDTGALDLRIGKFGQVELGLVEPVGRRTDAA